MRADEGWQAGFPSQVESNMKVKCKKGIVNVHLRADTFGCQIMVDDKPIAALDTNKSGGLTLIVFGPDDGDDDDEDYESNDFVVEVL